MSEIDDPRDFLSRIYAAETATTTAAVLLSHSMLVNGQRTTSSRLALVGIAAFKATCLLTVKGVTDEPQGLGRDRVRIIGLISAKRPTKLSFLTVALSALPSGKAV